MPRTSRGWLAGLLVLLTAGAVAAGIALVQLSSPTTTSSAGEQMLAVSPGGVVALDELRPELRELYLAVADDPTAFEAVRCYCGCEAMLEHRHLLDCFVRPDGGWERHAMGCAVCVAEARDVLDGLDAGDTTAEIRAAIDGRFGAITPGA